MISVIIPTSSTDYKKRMRVELPPCKEEVEELVIVNEPSFGRVRAKNLGAKLAKGEVLVFVDCDIKVSDNFLEEVSANSKDELFVGGGVRNVKLSRYSLGIVLGLFVLAVILLIKRVTIGAFWVKKSDFLAIGGFRDKKYDDIDFALRLKKYAKEKERKFKSLKDSYIIWSTRKLDKWGDWHWLKGYHVG